MPSVGWSNDQEMAFVRGLGTWKEGHDHDNVPLDERIALAERYLEIFDVVGPQRRWDPGVDREALRLSVTRYLATLRAARAAALYQAA